MSGAAAGRGDGARVRLRGDDLPGLPQRCELQPLHLLACLTSTSPPHACAEMWVSPLSSADLQLLVVGFVQLAQEHYSLLEYPSLQLCREDDDCNFELEPGDLLLPYIDDNSLYYLAAADTCSVTYRGATCQLAFTGNDSASDIRRKILNLFGSAIDCRVDDVGLAYGDVEVQLPHALESGATYAVLARNRLASARVSVHSHANCYVDVPIPATGEPVEAFKAMRQAAVEAFCIPPSIHLEFCRRDDADPARMKPVCIAEVLYDAGEVNYLSLLGHTIVPVSVNDHTVIYVAMPTELTTLSHVRQALIDFLELDCAPHEVELYSHRFEALLCRSAVVQQDDLFNMRVANADLSDLRLPADQLMVVQDAAPLQSPQSPLSSPSADSEQYTNNGSHVSRANVYDGAAVRRVLESIRRANPAQPYGTSGQIERGGAQGVVVPNFVGKPPVVRIEELPDMVLMLFQDQREPTPALAEYDDFARLVLFIGVRSC